MLQLTFVKKKEGVLYNAKICALMEPQSATGTMPRAEIDTTNAFARLKLKTK